MYDNIIDIILLSLSFTISLLPLLAATIGGNFAQNNSIPQQKLCTLSEGVENVYPRISVFNSTDNFIPGFTKS